MEWQPIETAPREGIVDTGVIVFDGNCVGEARYHSGRNCWGWAGWDPTDAWDGQCYPTHWQPLPAPPTPTEAQ